MATGMIADDIIVTLQDLGMLQRYGVADLGEAMDIEEQIKASLKLQHNRYVISLDVDKLKDRLGQIMKTQHPKVRDHCLHWVPFNLIK